MVKVSSRGKNVEHSFREDVGIISISRREDNIIFLGSDSKFCGQGGFPNVFIVEQDGLLYPVNPGIVFC